MNQKVLLIILLIFSNISCAQSVSTPLTFINNMMYIDIDIQGMEHRVLLDTGSASTILNTNTIKNIQPAPRYSGHVWAGLADGTVVSLPTYRIKYVKIAGCQLKNVEIISSKLSDSRNILGLNILRPIFPLVINGTHLNGWCR